MTASPDASSRTSDAPDRAAKTIVQAPPPPTSDRLLELLRYAVLALAGVGTLGAVWELAAERHWGGTTQLVAWAAVAALAVAVGLAATPRPRLVDAARWVALAVLAASAFGIAEHLLVNIHAGHLDPRYAAGWADLPALTRVWLGATKTIGNAPPLAPGMLGQSALLVLLGTVGRGTSRARKR